MTSCRKEPADCRRIWTAWLPGRDPQPGREALAWLEAEAGNQDRALHWLEHLLDKHEVWLIIAEVNPLFDPLRAQPRFQSILERLRL